MLRIIVPATIPNGNECCIKGGTACGRSNKGVLRPKLLEETSGADVLIRKTSDKRTRECEEPTDSNPIRQGRGAWAYFAVLEAARAACAGDSG